MDRLHVRGGNSGQGPYRGKGSREGGQEGPVTRQGQPLPVTTLQHKKGVPLITGPVLQCRNWQIEGALRMLHNVLQPDVAKNPDELIVYGGTGRAARSWEALETIERSEEHTSELQSLAYLVCRLLLEKKKRKDLI